MKLQEILVADPASGFSGTPTGFFGTITMKAVIKFQTHNGISSSSKGFFGPMSRGFLERSCGKGLMKDHEGDDNASSTKSHGDDHWTSTTTTVPTVLEQWMGRWSWQKRPRRLNLSSKINTNIPLIAGCLFLGERSKNDFADIR
jgi:peptidoglycan hydrolase-like protein with peptidoglycan-binding domain